MLFGSVFGDFLKPGIVATLDDIVETIYEKSTFADGPWIAGGMARQLAINNTETEFSDIDIWFKCSAQLEECRIRMQEKYGVNMWQEWASDNALTYNVSEYKVQFIKKRFFSSIHDVFDYFDFTCCQIAIDKSLKPFGPGIDDARNNVLRVNRLNSDTFLARYAKYVGYGYVMKNKEFLDIINNNQFDYDFNGSTIDY